LVSARGLATETAPVPAKGGGELRVFRRGNSAIKRAALVSGLAGFKVGSGSASSHAASFRAAVSAGRSARLAASTQGSSSIRASTDTTLSGIPLRSSPTSANRKLSNSNPRGGIEAVGVISISGPAASSLPDHRRSDAAGQYAGALMNLKQGLCWAAFVIRQGRVRDLLRKSVAETLALPSRIS